jgi:hypothetical protein
MKYPKKFEKWYNKNVGSRGIFDYGKNEEVLKDCCFHAWKAAAERVVKRVSFINRISDHNWQHEDVDSLQDYAKELFKDE